MTVPIQLIVGVWVIGVGLLVLLRGGAKLGLVDDPRPAMQVLLSAVIGIAALIIILGGGYSEDHEKWAFGILGTILGYWFPS